MTGINKSKLAALLKKAREDKVQDTPNHIERDRKSVV